jgi:hypothetical protein
VAKNAKKAYTIPKVKDMTIPEPLEKGMPIYDEDVIGADEGDLLAVEQEAQERASRERHLAEEKAAEYDKRIADQIASEERKRGITGEQYNEVKPGVFIKVHRDGNPIQGWDVIMAAHKNIASIWKDPKDPWLGRRLDRFDQQFRRNLQLIWGKKAANHQPNAFDHAALLELGERVDDRDIRPNEAEWLRDRAYRIAQMYRRGELKI